MKVTCSGVVVGNAYAENFMLEDGSSFEGERRKSDDLPSDIELQEIIYRPSVIAERRRYMESYTLRQQEKDKEKRANLNSAYEGSQIKENTVPGKKVVAEESFEFPEDLNTYSAEIDASEKSDELKPDKTPSVNSVKKVRVGSFGRKISPSS
jgi:hypothetical protein